MENYTISLSTDKEIHHFRIEEYPHDSSGTCKYQVFKEAQYVASFEPDQQGFLHICKNPSGMEEELLNLLADQIELRHPQERHLDDLQAIELDGDDEVEAL